MKGVVASVMHTGTWFTFEVIERLTGDVVLPWRHTFESGANDCDWLHVHVNEDPWSKVRYIRPMLIEAFVEKAQYPTVIPLRDPVLALISRHLGREQDHVPVTAPLFEMVEGFSRLAEWYAEDYRHIHWFPVDLCDGISTQTALRVGLLGALCSFFDRHSIRRKRGGFVQRLATEWPICKETHALSTLKQRYLAGDVEAVEAVLPAEMEALRCRPEIAEMFADLGYTLPWV